MPKPERKIGVLEARRQALDYALKALETSSLSDIFGSSYRGTIRDDAVLGRAKRRAIKGILGLAKNKPSENIS